MEIQLEDSFPKYIFLHKNKPFAVIVVKPDGAYLVLSRRVRPLEPNILSSKLIEDKKEYCKFRLNRRLITAPCYHIIPRLKSHTFQLFLDELRVIFQAELTHVKIRELSPTTKTEKKIYYELIKEEERKE